MKPFWNSVDAGGGGGGGGGRLSLCTDEALVGVPAFEDDNGGGAGGG